MKTTTSIILLLISFGLSAQTQNLSNSYTKANNLYKTNNYSEAIVIYEDILSSGFESSEIYYNLANSYFKNKNIAKSILNYERALKIAPKDKDIQNNLKYANLYVKDEFNEVPEFFMDKIIFFILNIFKSDTWAILSILFFSFSLALFIVFLFSKIISRRKFAFYISILFLVISIASFSFSYSLKKNNTTPQTAIIMEINTMKSSPENDGTDLFILNPGVKVKIKEITDNWIEISLPNGKIGWIKKDMIEII